MTPGQTMPKHLYKYVVGVFLVSLAVRIVLCWYYNNSLGGIEPNVIYGIQRILLGQPLYQDPVAGSFAIMQYTPLYYYCMAATAKLCHIGGTDVQSIYMLCRIMAVIFNLMTVGVAAFMIRSMGADRIKSLVFALPIFIILTSHYYTRGDSMHLLLFVCAMYAYLNYSKRGELAYLLVAAMFSAGCIMVKQSGILCIGITGFCLLFIERKFLATIIYSLFTAAFCWSIANSCVQGDWPSFYNNAYLGLKNGVDIAFLHRMFTSQYFFDIVPFYILGGIMVWLAVTKITDKTYRIIITGATLSFLFAVITGLKVGSSNNYFTEFLVFVLIGLPYLLQHEAGRMPLLKTGGRTISFHQFAYVVFFVLITSKAIGLFSGVYIEKGFKNMKEEYDRELQLYSYFNNELHLKDGERIFFTERRFLDNIFINNAIMPNKDVVSQIYNPNPNTYDYSGFIAGMNNGLIRYIVTDEQRNDINACNDSMPFVRFDTNRFTLVGRKAGYCVYALNQDLKD